MSETETFEVKETVTTPPEAKVPTRDDLKEKGWSAKEIESAQKHGMLEKHDPPEIDKKLDPVVKVEEEKKPEEKVRTEDRRTGSPLPDFTFKTPEQEKAFMDAFGPGTPQRAMYFRMKNERQSRQKAEAERDQERKEREALTARIDAMEKGKGQPEVDEDGNVIDPDDKPLTMKQLRQMQQDEAQRIEEKQKKESDENRRRTDAQQAQEEYARSLYPDFDDTVALTIDLGKIINSNQLEEKIPERWKQAKLLHLFRQLQGAAYNSDKLDLDDYHAALIAYEIGQLHPSYGRKTEEAPASTNGSTAEQDGKTKDPKKANGGQLTPEQMKRIEETQRKTSSAAITGGGGLRSISAEDVDAGRLNQMTYKERQRFREKHPDRYAKIMRG